MRDLKAATLVLLAAFTGPAAVAQQDPLRAAVVLIDVGPGGDIFRNAVYAAQATEIVNAELAALSLGEGDTLILKTFGSPNLLDHLTLTEWNRNITFAFRGAQVRDIPGFMDARITNLAGVPTHPASNLTAGLAELATMGLCKDHEVVTIVLSNGLEIGEVSGQDFLLPSPPPDARLCGRIVWVGLWVDDPAPVPGLRSEALDLFIQFSELMGVTDVAIRR